MGFFQRRAEQEQQAREAVAANRDRLAQLFTAPAPLPQSSPQPWSRPDPVTLLGRRITDSEPLFREFGLVRVPGNAGNRSAYYQSASTGIEVIVDANGVIQTVFLHTVAADGLQPYTGPFPGATTQLRRRAELRAAYGTPDMEAGPRYEEYLGQYGPCGRWDGSTGFTVHAQYDLDGETLKDLTLTLKEPPSLPDSITAPRSEPVQVSARVHVPEPDAQGKNESWLVEEWFAALVAAQPGYGPLLTSTLDEVGQLPAVRGDGVYTISHDRYVMWAAASRSYAYHTAQARYRRALLKKAAARKAGDEGAMLELEAEHEFWESVADWVDTTKALQRKPGVVPAWLAAHDPVWNPSA